jgi:hypothetical protein
MPDQCIDQMVERQHAEGDSISLPALLPELLLPVLGFLPRNEVATTARQLCKQARQHFRDKTVVHLKDADLPFHALVWAFLHSLSTIKQRSQLVDCRAAAGDMPQVEWLVVGWQEAVRVCSDSSGECLTGWSLLWQKPQIAEMGVAYIDHQAATPQPASSSIGSASAAHGRSGVAEQAHANQAHEPLVFCPWLWCTGAMRIQVRNISCSLSKN